MATIDGLGTQTTVETLGMVTVTELIRADVLGKTALSANPSGSLSKGHTRSNLNNASDTKVAAANSQGSIQHSVNLTAVATGLEADNGSNSEIVYDVSIDNFSSGNVTLFISGKFVNTLVFATMIGAGTGLEIYQATLNGNGVAIITIPFEVKA